MGATWVLIRRSLTDPQRESVLLRLCPEGTTLQEMVQAIGARWHIEEDFANAKDLGLDHYEVRSFAGWYRHITLGAPGSCLLDRDLCNRAFAPLLLLLLLDLPARPAVLALTVPEVRHLLARLIWPASSSAHQVLAWSWWRRSHQCRASYYHTKRRLKAG